MTKAFDKSGAVRQKTPRPAKSKNQLARRFIACLFTAAGLITMTLSSTAGENSQTSQLKTGAQVLVTSNFEAIAGKRVALITNQTGLVDGDHLVDLMHKAPNVDLVAILGPEHGFRGTVEAGKVVKDGRDPKTGVPVYSLYGDTKKPTQAMLRNVDVLVFDIQDIGVRFYTYISTMGLAMQAAAQARIPFIVLDRPNPLGGTYVSGFVLEPKHTSFVGQYPIPIVHGLTVAELASMIKGRRWLKGLENLDLGVMLMEGWNRSMRWPATKLKWVSTSPNIPTFRSALVYPGVGIIGETQLVNEGRGMPQPFTMFGAPWLDAKQLSLQLNALKLPGVTFKATKYRPVSIPKIAANPLFVGRTINGVELVITHVDSVKPLEIGIHALPLIIKQARTKRIKRLFANLPMFHLIAGNRRLHAMLVKGKPGRAIIASWQSELATFTRQRNEYLLY